MKARQELIDEETAIEAQIFLLQEELEIISKDIENTPEEKIDELMDAINTIKSSYEIYKNKSNEVFKKQEIRIEDLQKRNRLFVKTLEEYKRKV
jgi:hypothetical protein